MQWLIDIIKEWVLARGYLTTGFVDRGDPTDFDFKTGDFIQDATWRDLDLSAIVPAGAKAVLFRTAFTHLVVGKYFNLRRDGNVNEFNTFTVKTMISGISMYQDGNVTISTDRKLEYNISEGFTTLLLVVKGWWL